MEHLIIAFKAFISVVIPDVPDDIEFKVRCAKRRDAQTRAVALEKQARLRALLMPRPLGGGSGGPPSIDARLAAPNHPPPQTPPLPPPLSHPSQGYNNNNNNTATAIAVEVRFLLFPVIERKGGRGAPPPVRTSRTLIELTRERRP